MTKKLIPFSRELYEKGYKAVRRDGLEVLGIFFSENKEDSIYPIYYIWRKENGSICTKNVDDNGEGCIGDYVVDNLFLEAKTIDLWIGLYKGDYPLTTTKAYLDKDMLLTHSNVRKIKITVDAETLEQV